MPKVKMRDIKSGSEEVKKVFRRPMTSRKKPLKNQTFTNDELLEILYISENIEHHKDKREFYQELIKSQKGPFDNKVFGEFVNKLFQVDSLLHLLENSKGISEENKLEWIEYSMVTSTSWTVLKFFSKDAGTSYGIDITASPYRSTYAEKITRYADRAGKGNINDGYLEELQRMLDAMNSDEIEEWYHSAVAKTYEKKAIVFLMNYDKMPQFILEDYWNRTTIQNKEKLALHPNIPDKLRQEMYNQTGDEQYLPEDVKNVFLF